MIDIATRLRAGGCSDNDCAEGAEEIQKLRASLKDLIRIESDQRELLKRTCEERNLLRDTVHRMAAQLGIAGINPDHVVKLLDSLKQ